MIRRGVPFASITALKICANRLPVQALSTHLHPTVCPVAMLHCHFGPVRICPGTLAFIPGTVRDPKTLFVGSVARRLVRQRVAVFIQTKRVAQVAFCLHIRPENDDGIVDAQDDRDNRNGKKRVVVIIKFFFFLLFGLFAWVEREDAQARAREKCGALDSLLQYIPFPKVPLFSLKGHAKKSGYKTLNTSRQKRKKMFRV